MRDMNPPVMTPWNDSLALAGHMSVSTVTKGPERMRVIGSYTRPGPDVGAQDKLLPVAQWTASVAPGMFHESGSVTALPGAASAWNLTRATARYRNNLAQIVPTGAVNRNTPNGLTPRMLSGMERARGRSANPADPTHDLPLAFQHKRRAALASGAVTSFPKAPPWYFQPYKKPTLGNPSGTDGNPPVTTTGTPTTPAPTPQPLDPQAQLLGSLFGGGGGAFAPDQGAAPVQQVPASGGGTSGLVVLGAIAGIAGLGYLWYTRHKRRAA
jgi:hypothetical protein